MCFFFPHDDLNVCDSHRFLSNESAWLELKRPGREADLSNLSNSEATYVCVCVCVCVCVWAG